MSNTAKRRIKEVEGRLDSITANVGRLDEDVITELFRRASISATPDGFPATAVADRTSGSKSSEDGIGRPTEELALRNIAGYRVQDPVRKVAERVLDLIRKADFHLEDALQALEHAAFSVEEAKQRPTTIPCLICQELPAEKAGFCLNDYNDWWRYGKPDRQAWISYKTGLRNSASEVLVEECPQPSAGNKAIRGPWKAENASG